MDSILYPFAVAVAWLWVRIHDLLLLLGMNSGAGFTWVLSIVLLTILVRVLIIPLYLKQLKSMRGTSIVQPQMQKIQAKYKGKTDMASRQRMQQEISELNKKYGVNPFASCLPMLVQLPVLFAMYRACRKQLPGRFASRRLPGSDHSGRRLGNRFLAGFRRPAVSHHP